MDNRQLLTALNQLKDEINQQIPLASNRYEQVETCLPVVDASIRQETYRRLFAESVAFSQEIWIKQNQWQTYQHYNEEFDEFLKAHCLQSTLHITQALIDKFKAQITASQTRLTAKLQRIARFSRSDDVNASAAQTVPPTLDVNQMVAQLVSGQRLQLADSELEKRFHLNAQVCEHREIFNQQSIVNPWDDSTDMSPSRQVEHLKKISFLHRGMYLDRAAINTGFCGEHTNLALFRLFKRRLVSKDMVVEKIAIRYKEGDGHTFIAINRKPDSELNQFSTWGENAIILDPWNKIVFYAKDIDSLPLYYLSFPEHANWVIEASYAQVDDSMLFYVDHWEQQFIIAGNEDRKQRETMIRDEYALQSIDQPGLHKLQAHLLSQCRTLRPANFNYQVNMAITTEGSSPLRIIPGLTQATIAIHQAAILHNIITAEELSFAIERMLCLIKHFPQCSETDLSDTDYNQLNALLINKNHHALIAISYLQKCLQFRKKFTRHQHQTIDVIGIMISRFMNQKGDETRQIKYIETLLATNHSLGEHVSQTQLDPAFREEVSTLQPLQFFTPDLASCKTRLAQIRFLTKCLPELRKELVPYEMDEYPSVRLREYCELVRQLNINLYDEAETTAADELINSALSLRISGFDKIYRAILNAVSDKYKFADAPRLKPLGKFKTLQRMIDKFVHADSRQVMQAVSQELNALIKELASHFESTNISNYAYATVSIYKKNHSNKLPTGNARYFGSTIGYYLALSGFKDELYHDSPYAKPWDQHVQFASMDKTRSIARSLWLLGVVRDTRLWQLYDYTEMMQLTNTSSCDDTCLAPIIELNGNWSRFGDNHKLLVTRSEYMSYKALHHILDTSMFANKTLSFEEAFTRYYDVNRPVLIIQADGSYPSYQAVDYLLEQFSRVALSDSATDKQVVKSFFLGRSDGRDIAYLQRDGQCGKRIVFSSDSVYVKFFIDQQYRSSSFDLFTTEEILTAFVCRGDIISFASAELSLMQFARIFRLPINQSDSATIFAILFQMKKHNLNGELSNALCDYTKTIKHPILSREASNICEVMSDALVNPFYAAHRLSILHSFIWKYVPLIKLPENITVIDIITIYRTLDVNLAFASRDQQQFLGNLIWTELEKSHDDLALPALQELLFNRKKYLEPPISDLHLRNLAIMRWVNIIANKFGKDTGDDQYCNRIIPVIKMIADKAATRDVVIIYDQLANAIESQQFVSDTIGIILEPEKYSCHKRNTSGSHDVLGVLSQLTAFLGKDPAAQKQFIDFLSTPLSEQSQHAMAEYIIKHNLADQISQIMGYQYRSHGNQQNDRVMIENICRLIYYMFWDLPLEERAVTINYLLIPPAEYEDQAAADKVYHAAFEYVAHKLFPDAHKPDSEDHLAYAILSSYLQTADVYERGYLMTGMLVVSNEVQADEGNSSVGRKFALMCEHMGPAYIKLAQAIHSHHETSLLLKRALDHVKGRAHPPPRWVSWRLLAETLPPDDLRLIKRFSRLLGSASYNLALEVTLLDGSHVVVSLLREQAEHNAKKGFAHIHRTITHCTHPRVQAVSATVGSIIKQAAQLSECEMSHAISQKQYAMAEKLYHRQMIINDKHTVIMKPTRLIRSGQGYRFIDLISGIEFNHLTGEKSRYLRTLVSKAVLTTELGIMLQGKNFDSDRHGNQLCVQVDHDNTIRLGLYDFGEMSLDHPTLDEIHQLADVISQLPTTFIYYRDVSAALDYLMSENITRAVKENKPTTYLMRVRKSLLALHDFQQHISFSDWIDILSTVTNDPMVHPVLCKALSTSITLLNAASFGYSVKNFITSGFGFFPPPEELISMEPDVKKYKSEYKK